MNLISFLLRSSWGMVAIAIVTGFLSGSSSAALIALISRAVSQEGNLSIQSLAWSFLGLAIVALITSIISQVVLIRLSQDAILQLRMRLSRQILSSELSHLEQLGTPRLLATLTEDVQAVANAVSVIPFLCIDLCNCSGLPALYRLALVENISDGFRLFSSGDGQLPMALKKRRKIACPCS
jgi:putative ATP-binding cassette transporter